MSDEIENGELSENEQAVNLDAYQKEIARLAGELDKAEFEKQLAIALNREGVLDLDAAMKLAGNGIEPREIIEELKRERNYLFPKLSDNGSHITASVKADNRFATRSKLSDAAIAAKTSGSRHDICEYLKLRRTLLR